MQFLRAKFGAIESKVWTDFVVIRYGRRERTRTADRYREIGFHRMVIVTILEPERSAPKLYFF